MEDSLEKEIKDTYSNGFMFESDNRYNPEKYDYIFLKIDYYAQELGFNRYGELTKLERMFLCL